MEEEKLMTEAEYDQRLREWSRMVHQRAQTALVVGTHATGRLAESIQHFVDKMKDGKGRHIAFRFDPYGVFRQYGAGRGWVIINGVPVPGYRVVPLRLRYGAANSRLWGIEAQEMLHRGWNRSQVRNAKMVFTEREQGHKREPLDWLDGNIQIGANELANIAQSYWGDVALASLAQQLQKAKIKKS